MAQTGGGTLTLPAAAQHLPCTISLFLTSGTGANCSDSHSTREQTEALAKTTLLKKKRQGLAFQLRTFHPSQERKGITAPNTGRQWVSSGVRTPSSLLLLPVTALLSGSPLWPSQRLLSQALLSRVLNPGAPFIPESPFPQDGVQHHLCSQLAHPPAAGHPTSNPLPPLSFTCFIL